eukprot:scaffold2053_cov106-Skeletonema_dohrnii-CCMP3373.AAC.7
MDPTMNDVLSGRGAWFNQHPGNKRFRRMLEEKKAAYSMGTKKLKMDISKDIVEAIYSMEPPGRFLKKCPSTGQWNEISKRDAADRAAQAMAYAIKGESLKLKRRQRRLHSSPSLQPQENEVVGTKSSQGVDRPTTNRSGGEVSSLGAQGLSPQRGGALDARNGVPSATEQLRVPGNSNLQQQLLQQLQQSISTHSTLPTTLGSSIDQNVLLQTLQQQQQQFPLQYTFGQNPLGHLLQSQAPPQIALHEGLTQMLAQQQQQQYNAQQQLILQHLLSQQQNVLPSATLPPPISLSASVLTGNRSQPANSNLLQGQIHVQSHPSMFGVLSNNLQHQPNSNTAISNAPQEAAQQMDQLQRSLMLQQNQLLASSLSASSNNQWPSQQHQLQLLDPILQQTLQADLLRQNLQLPPSINFAGLVSANVAAQSTEQEGREDEEHGGPEDDN